MRFQVSSLIECGAASVANKGFFAGMGQHVSVQTVGASEILLTNMANNILVDSFVMQLKRYSDIINVRLFFQDTRRTAKTTLKQMEMCATDYFKWALFIYEFLSFI